MIRRMGVVWTRLILHFGELLVDELVVEASSRRWDSWDLWLVVGVWWRLFEPPIALIFVMGCDGSGLLLGVVV